MIGNKNIVIGGTKWLNHTSVILDALRNRYPHRQFTASDGGIIFLIGNKYNSKLHKEASDMSLFCDGAVDALELVEKRVGTNL